MFTHTFSEENFLKYAQKAIEIFGASRCMLGSNFPVDKLYSSYSTIVNAWNKLLDGIGTRESEWVAYKSASQFYAITSHKTTELD